MNKWLKLGTVAMLVAVIALMALGTGAAFAQGPTTTPPLAGLGLRLGGPQNSLVAIAAKTLGLDQAALVAELTAGKTIADVAKAKNVAVSKIVDAMVANRTAALKAAVDAKRITQARMDAELKVMKDNVTTRISNKWTPRGYAQGIGRERGYGTSTGTGRGYGMGSGSMPNRMTAQPSMGRGNGMGAGFVDANKDGICDHCGAAGSMPNRTTAQPFMGRGRMAR
jgi:hypothetical protein